jgi:hypothetical protein
LHICAALIAFDDWAIVALDFELAFFDFKTFTVWAFATDV